MTAKHAKSKQARRLQHLIQLDGTAGMPETIDGKTQNSNKGRKARPGSDDRREAADYLSF